MKIDSIIPFIVLGFALYSAAENNVVAADKPWAKHCTLVGVPEANEKSEVGRMLHEFADRCEPVDACLLSCMRNHCDEGAGGCFHDCGPEGFANTRPLDVLANMYEVKDTLVCPVGPIK